MIKFLITSTINTYTGSVVIIYMHNTLVRIDTQDCEMKPKHRQWFYRNVPLAIHDLIPWFETTSNLTLIQEDYEVSLDDFNREYPYKRNTHLLPDIWKKMPKADQIKAVQAAKAYRYYCQKNDNWYKPKIAAAWLKAKEYLNDWKKM